ncbi:MAG: hypothetical protein JW778_06000, partial [Candidatus Altiarchaeota archaeon]|nr:hypothetical protein [Candidatus Altiarchaeota archaeon]
MFSKEYGILFTVSMLLLLNGVIAEECTVELKNPSKGVHIVVESCGNIGTFSVGGLYDKDKWEKLTYNYPETWKGTFLSVKVDDRVYSNFVESQDKVFMDPYVEQQPTVEGESILTTWRLPGDVRLEERFGLIDKGVMLNVTIINEGDVCVDTGIRLHLDTMLGENDGAPI